MGAGHAISSKQGWVEPSHTAKLSQFRDDGGLRLVIARTSRVYVQGKQKQREAVWIYNLGTIQRKTARNDIPLFKELRLLTVMAHVEQP
jgi:hypothetical protein